MQSEGVTVKCQIEHAERIVSLCSIGFQVMTASEELKGYRIVAQVLLPYRLNLHIPVSLVSSVIIGSGVDGYTAQYQE